jgi:hypothetical protein
VTSRVTSLSSATRGHALPEGMRGDTGVDGVEDSDDNPAYRREKQRKSNADHHAAAIINQPHRDAMYDEIAAVNRLAATAAKISMLEKKLIKRDLLRLSDEAVDQIIQRINELSDV